MVINLELLANEIFKIKNLYSSKIQVQVHCCIQNNPGHLRLVKEEDEIQLLKHIEYCQSTYNCIRPRDARHWLETYIKTTRVDSPLDTKKTRLKIVVFYLIAPFLPPSEKKETHHTFQSLVQFQLMEWL